MGKKFGLSFSWKRAVGLSAAKGRISRGIGVPLTKQGRQRKWGQATGCSFIFLFIITTIIIFKKLI
jgi:hypothetical protein